MRRHWVMPCVIAILMLALFAAAGRAAQASCESLAKLSLPDTKITLAQVVPAGTFPAPPPQYPGQTPPSFKDVPAFCRVAVDIAPTSDSDIKIEVWMPVADWNGKFRGQGNGGFAGVIDYSGMGDAVRRGYASAGTDTGHTTTDAAWALGHPEKVIDFGYRGIHEMTAKAKAMVDAFYGRAPQHTYFASCSDGGREALMEAQRFPADYDGILAGAPANYWTHLLVAGMWTVRATSLDPASYIPASKIPALSKAVLAACDAQDGLSDGLLNDPRQCHLDPDTIICKAADADTCLTAPQAAALKKIYDGPHDLARLWIAFDRLRNPETILPRPLPTPLSVRPRLGGNVYDTINGALGFVAFFAPLGVLIVTAALLATAQAGIDAGLVSIAAAALGIVAVGIYLPSALAATHKDTSYFNVILCLGGVVVAVAIFIDAIG